MDFERFKNINEKGSWKSFKDGSLKKVTQAKFKGLPGEDITETFTREALQCIAGEVGREIVDIKEARARNEGLNRLRDLRSNQKLYSLLIDTLHDYPDSKPS